MAKEGPDGQEKTEQPTEKRRGKARQEGQVARSQDVNFVAILIAALIYFALRGSDMINSLRLFIKKILVSFVGLEITPITVTNIAREVLQEMMFILMPFMLLLFAVSIIINIFQFGFLFTTKPFVPKLDKFNVVKGIKRLFGISKLFDIVKSVAKLIVIAAVPFIIIRNRLDELPLVMDMHTWSIMAYIGKIMLVISFYVSIVMVLIAIIDFVFQKWKHNRDLMMSKQEVKDERKQSEGDPKVKERIRRLQIENLRKAMMEQVPDADVVITNPIHYAIALKYDRDKMDAPKVIAKGARKLAQKIVSIAREHNVPVIENRPLAQSLYKMVDVGDLIPESLYKAVAEVLAYVYRQSGGARAAG